MVAVALAALAAAACGGPQDAAPAQPSAAGLQALADAEPPGTQAIGWREIEGMGVAAWLFYPAAPLPPAARAANDLAAPPSVPQSDLPGDYADNLRRRFGPVASATLVAAPGHARRDADMARGAHPLLIFMPGAAMGGRDYRLFAEALAASGHAVAVLRPLASPGASDERYAAAAAEIVSALGHLSRIAAAPESAGRIDAARPVLVGHSLGGAAAVLAAVRTGACAVNVDGDFGGASAAAAPTGPVLYLIGDPALDRASDVARRDAVWRKVSARSGGQALALGIAGMRHFDIADAAHLPPRLIPEERREGRFGPIGGAAARRLLVDLVGQFALACRTDRDAPLSQTLRLPPQARPIFAR